jgi:hypothetical protein
MDWGHACNAGRAMCVGVRCLQCRRAMSCAARAEKGPIRPWETVHMALQMRASAVHTRNLIPHPRADHARIFLSMDSCCCAVMHVLATPTQLLVGLGAGSGTPAVPSALLLAPECLLASPNRHFPPSRTLGPLLRTQLLPTLCTRNSSRVNLFKSPGARPSRHTCIGCLPKYLQFLLRCMAPQAWLLDPA